MIFADFRLFGGPRDGDVVKCDVTAPELIVPERIGEEMQDIAGVPTMHVEMRFSVYIPRVDARGRFLELNGKYAADWKVSQ